MPGMMNMSNKALIGLDGFVDEKQLEERTLLYQNEKVS